MSDRRVGVVVIGRNEGERLRACLQSIDRPATVVYADSASTDDSVAIARGLGVEVVELAGGEIPLTAARGRNAGARKALAIDPDLEFIQFIDGDCILDDTWVPHAVRFLAEHPLAAVVCGRRRERDPQFSIYNAMCDREWDTPIGQADACGGDALMRVSAFQAIGGFADDQVAHEEPEMCGRLRAAGWQVHRIDRPMTIHDAAISTVRQFYRRSHRAGLGMTQCLLRGGDSRDAHGGKIVARAMFWAVALPIAILGALVVSTGLAALLAALYPVHIARNAIRNRQQGWQGRDALRIAWLGLVGKFAEAHGALSFVARSGFTRTREPSSYK